MQFWSVRGIDLKDLEAKFGLLNGNDTFDFGSKIVDLDQTMRLEKFLNILEVAGLQTRTLTTRGPLTFQAMLAHVETETEVKRKCDWITKHLVRNLAEALPVAPCDDITTWILSADQASLAAAFSDFPEWLKFAATKAEETSRAVSNQESEQNIPGGNSEKMTSMKLETIAQFYSGVDGLIQGSPHPDVNEGVKLEHTEAADSNDEFFTTNYKVNTTAAGEYMAVIDEKIRNQVNAKKESKDMHRLVLDPEECMEYQKVQEAGLSQIEVVALILYTGPMFAKYNAVLRGFPPADVEGCRGNSYTTTVHVLVSGLRKLSRVSPVPPNGLVFRGVGGLEPPEELMRSDALGVRGGVERGVLSTTKSRAVAIFYSKRSDSPRRILLEIMVGAVDRPASISFLSQYQREEELTFGPLSFLEYVNQRVETAPDGGSVLVLRVRISANLTGMTLEERVAQRSKVVASLAVWVGHGLENAAEAFAREMADRAGIPHRNIEHVGFTRDAGVSNLVWYAKHQLLSDYKQVVGDLLATAAETFNDNVFFDAAVSRVLAMDRFTRESLELARMDPENLAKYNLPEWHVRFNHNELCDKLLAKMQMQEGDGGSEAAGLRLAHLLGLIETASPQALEKKNEVGKTALFEAVEGGDLRGMKVLIAARANVQARDAHSCTALMTARDGEAVRALVAAGADVNARRPEVLHTGLQCCAVPGRVEALRALLECGADPMLKCSEGKTALDYAMQFGQKECARILEEAMNGANKEAEKGNEKGRAEAADKAASRACIVA